MYDDGNIHCNNEWYILMNLVIFIIIENTLLIVVNQCIYIDRKLRSLAFDRCI